MHDALVLRPTRPSLLDHLVHATLLRAFAAARDRGVSPLCLDGTAGNGHDTLFLAESAPDGALILAFDIQADAIAATERRLALEQERRSASGQPLRTRWRCLCRGHEHLADVLHELPQEDALPLMAAVFNFGWLPGGDRLCITRPETSLRAVQSVLEHLEPCGCLCLHCYTGHPGGSEEETALSELVSQLPPRYWRVFCGRDSNRQVGVETGRGRHESLILVERLPLRQKQVQASQ